MNQVEEGLKYLHKMDVHNSHINNKRIFGYMFTIYAFAYTKQKRYRQAINYDLKAIQAFKEVNDPLGVYDVLINLSTVYLTIGKVDSANYYIQKGLLAVQKTDAQMAEAQLYINEGDYYSTKKKYSSAIESYQKALNTAQAINHLKTQKEAHKHLAEAFEMYGNKTLALNHYKSYVKINDSLINIENQKQIAQLNLKYKTEKKEQKITLLEKENKLKQVEIQKKALQRNWLIGFFLFLMAVASILFLQYRKTKAAKDKIEMLQREIHHRVKNNLAINRRMVEVAEERVHDEESKLALQQLSNRIASMINIHQQLYQKQDITNVDFKKYMDDINNNISSSLEMDPPTINQNFTDDIEIDFVKAVPLGLIVNELLTNSYKYAGRESIPPKITLDVTKDKMNIKLRVSDNGKGFPVNFDVRRIRSYGLKLVYGLTQQLNGTVNFFNSNGAVVEIVVPL